MQTACGPVVMVAMAVAAQQSADVRTTHPAKELV
jgi:hypothetical protein